VRGGNTQNQNGITMGTGAGELDWEGIIRYSIQQLGSVNPKYILPNKVGVSVIIRQDMN